MDRRKTAVVSVVTLLFVVVLVALLTHESRPAVLFGRYSVRYAIFLALLIQLYAACLLIYCRGWASFFHTYRYLGTTTLSVVIIITLLCAGVELYDVAVYQDPTGSERQSSYRARAKILGLTLEDVAVLQRETQDNFDNYEYQPWLLFRDKPRQGKFVTIADEGYRKTAGAVQGSEFSIFLFGGSTQFGYLVPDKDTIASHLQKKLNRTFGLTSFEVRNYGRTSYYSTQELILLLMLLKESLQPDVVVFVDGHNEGSDMPAYSNGMARIFNRVQSSHNSSIDDLILLLQRLPLYRKLRPYIWEYSSIGNTDFSDYPPPVVTVENYRFVQRVVRALSLDYEFSAHFFIQPAPGFRNEFNTHEFAEDYLSNDVDDGFLETIAMLSKESGNLWKTHDLTDLLQHYDEQPFIDADHYTPAVNELIAHKILETINSDLSRLVLRKRSSGQ